MDVVRAMRSMDSVVGDLHGPRRLDGKRERTGTLTLSSLRRGN